ncbi:sulfurtransferase complex subunit TusC [Marinospirillum sp.]|uniref:sulfurtransferase complex subunit TusC n=1 Tax=Marinospirillum sp. TaxID=2183934 RepID=UPI0028705536|nr:sulfurtransferase complex subunit TusC [Marinospirillum sp.]MDR9468516.1 sulfurtransferase complex subunit TusC [Marinospirillum sp.]
MSRPDFDLLVILTQPPLAGTAAKEGLDTALVSATFEQKTALAFLGEGVLQLVKGQQPDQLQLKGIQSMLKALPFYDLQAVYTDALALQQFGLNPDELLLNHQPATAEQLQQLIAKTTNTLVF